MLSNPNIEELMEKAGTRYEVALAIAKRARAISKRRRERENYNIKDTVDIAAKEILEERSFVKINGKYVLNKSEEDIDKMISDAVESILEDLNVSSEDMIDTKEDEILEYEEEPKKEEINE